MKTYQIKVQRNLSKVPEILPNVIFYSERALLFNIQFLQQSRLYSLVQPVTSFNLTNIKN